MEKTQLNTIIVISFCSAMLDFMLSGQRSAIFPRDRILHILISSVVFYIVAYTINEIDFGKAYWKPLITFLMVCRIIFLMYRFIQYLSVFHGADTVSFILLTVVTAFLAVRIEAENTGQLYTFFLMVNIFLAVLVMVLSAGRLNVANLYANDISFSFAPGKLFVFFDVLTIGFITPKGSRRIYVQKKYIGISAMAFVVITLIQGFCVKGNMMYSITPLQSLFQIFSSHTIKRFDFMLSIIQTINFFSVISLYMWCICGKFCGNKENKVENN